jgi:NodT family efflux transporter outer membrane factor (OMF) lipoprotein
MTSFTSKGKHSAPVVISLFLCACAPVGPDFVKPDVSPPPEWAQQQEQGLQAETADLSRWWQVFDDEALNMLVETALENNNNLEIAGLRVLEAQAQLGIAIGSQYPQSQIAAGSAIYNSPADSTGITSNFWQYGVGASASREIDFWGKFRRGIESADAAYLASIAAYDQARVLLVASVVDTYAVIRSFEEQLRIAHENLKIQRRSYDIANVLYTNGADSELDMQQAETLLLATKATIPFYEASIKQALNALSTLLGMPPGSVKTMITGATGIPTLPDNIAVGFPADMLRRRPDVRQAEMLAMSQNALVGMAEANLFFTPVSAWPARLDWLPGDRVTVISATFSAQTP